MIAHYPSLYKIKVLLIRFKVLSRVLVSLSMVRLSGSLSKVHPHSASLIDDFVHRAGLLYLPPLLLASNLQISVIMPPSPCCLTLSVNQTVILRMCSLCSVNMEHIE
jgi:hypothetical protein